MWAKIFIDLNFSSAQIFVTSRNFRHLSPTKNLDLPEFSWRIEICIKRIKSVFAALLRSIPVQKWYANLYWRVFYSHITKQKTKTKKHKKWKIGLDFILLLIHYIIFHIDFVKDSIVFGFTFWNDVTIKLLKVKVNVFWIHQ